MVWRRSVPSFEYDIFENLPDGDKIWLDCVHGIEAASKKVEELGRKTKHEIVAIRLPTKEIVARANAADAHS